MFTNGIRSIALIATLACCITPAHGSAYTYAFSGTLSQPYDGSSQFSGTFTYATDLPPYPGTTPWPGTAAYSGVPNDPTEPVVSLIFTLGNTPSSSFGTLSSDEVLVDHNLGGTPAGGDLFELTEQFIKGGNQSVYATIGLGNDDLVQRAPFSSTALPTSLSLADFSMGGSFTVEFMTAGGQETNVYGTITSLSEVSGAPTPNVPEPSSLVVFAGLVAAFFAHRGRNRRPTVASLMPASGGREQA
jgi:hypothetical protein